MAKIARTATVRVSAAVSRSFNVMPVSPVLISALDAGVRKYFVDVRDRYFFLLLISTVAVAVGIAMEGPEVLHEIIEEFDRFLHGRIRWEVDRQTGRPVTPRRLNWRKLLESFGWLLIVVGVSGEFVLEGLVFRSDRQLQTFENMTTSFALAEANERAFRAIERAAELSALLKTEQETTLRFQKQATLAEQALKEQLDRVDEETKRRGPRYVLLRDGNMGMDKRLIPFKGQRVSVVSCDNPMIELSLRGEAGLTATQLQFELSNKAKWSSTSVGNSSCGITATWVLFSSRADTSTRGAARALASVLTDVLLLRGPFGGITAMQFPKNFPVSPPDDPSAIVVLVAPRLQIDF